MIITKLLQKYKVGCGRGQSAVSEPNLQFILNSIIDWTQSEFEKYPEGVTPPEGYHEDPFLEPGDCFCFGESKREGQDSKRVVLAMDKGDQIVCILNDTGVLALQRIIDEKVKPEYSLLRDDYSKVTIKEWGPKVTATDLPGDLFEVPVNKAKYRLMKDQLLAGRGITMPEAFIEATVVSDDTLGMEIPLILTKYAVYTRTTDNMFTDIPGFMEDLVDCCLGWFYNEVPVIKDGKVLEKDEEESC